jgi:2-polyprenyl-3-methyl-5-hydroxy-6-metoxy-1,4-benzoquinol methylase
MADQISGLLSPFLRRRRLDAVGPFIREGRVLDYGCGVGELAHQIGPDRYLGVDLDSESIEIAKARHPGHTFQSLEDFESAKAGARFDVISALALIEHLPDPANWLAALKRHLNPGGRIVLTTPHPAMRQAHEWGAKYRIFSREAADEHKDLLDRSAIEALAMTSQYKMLKYSRFLFGCNQLVILQPV